MALPPEPVVLAALRWLEVLPGSGGIPRAQSLLHTHPRYSDLTPTQYATALSWLQDTGLTDAPHPEVPAAARILQAIFEKSAPPWVQDADVLVRGPEELPADIVSCGATLGLEPAMVFGQLVASWGKIDTAARGATGTAGEVALVEQLSGICDARVEHVAAWSDGFGYDVEYDHPLSVGHLEVKSTTRRGRFTAYLSRHEYEVMLRDPYWHLVTVRLNEDHEITAVGSVSRDWIADKVPVDPGPHGRWAAVRLDFPSTAIQSGIPALGPPAQTALPPWE